MMRESPAELQLLHIVEVPPGLFIVLALAPMSSVTRLHLLGRSMLNVSCQKQKPCGSFPAGRHTDRPMEFVGRARTSEACNLLDVPGLGSSDADDDEGEAVVGIRPKSSPQPRRRSSVTDDDDEDSEPEPPLCSSRRVSFADAKGLSLVQVKEFETWDEPKLPGYEAEGKRTDKYFLSLHTISLPSSADELLCRVQEQKVELETIELLPGTTILKGVIRVLNISFNKAVYVRTTLDGWCSHFDLLAEYVPGSSDGLMDSFSFKLTLVPPFSEQGARVDFCLRYETPAGTFWANNNNRNYVLFCQRGMNDQQEKPPRENANKRSCLKPVSQNLGEEKVSAAEASSQESSTVVSTQDDEMNTVKNKQISDNQAETSEEGEQKLQAEEEENSSRRSRRRASRMARLKGYFAQRDGEAGDAGGDESPAEAKQVATEENPAETNTGEGVRAVSAATDKGAEDTTQTHSYTSYSEPEKSESGGLGDSSTSAGGESAAETPDVPLRSQEEAASAESQNIDEYINDPKGDNDRIQKNGIEAREAKQEHSGAVVEEGEEEEQETSLIMMEITTMDQRVSLQDPVEIPHSDLSYAERFEPKPVSGDTEAHPHINSILNVANLTFDLQGQAGQETPHVKQTEHKSLEINMNSDKTRRQCQTQDVIASVATNETAFKSADEASVVAEMEKTEDASQVLNSGLIDNLVTKQTQQKEVGDELIESNKNAERRCGELKNEQSNVSDEDEHFEIKADAVKEEEFNFLESSKAKKWQIMIKEEETNVLTDETKSETIYLNDTETEGGQGGGQGDKRGKEKVDEARLEDPREKNNTTQDAAVLEVKRRIGEENTGHEAGKNGDVEKIFECAETNQMETIAGEDEAGKLEEQEEKGKRFTETLEVRGERGKIERGSKASVLEEDREENRKGEKWNYQFGDADSEGVTVEGREEEEDVGCFEEGRDVTRNVLEEGLWARVRGKESAGEGRRAHNPKGRDVGSNENVARGPSKAAAEERVSVSTEEPEGDQTSGASAESDSDDEVELYMRCLRAVHVGARADKDRNRDAARRSKKHLSTPMPPISESLDEEPRLHEDAAGSDVRPACPTSSRDQDHADGNVGWWKKRIPCSHIAKALLYVTSLVVFFVVAYHYDFIACFGLYVASVVWLCCQEETQPVKNNNRIG